MENLSTKRVDKTIESCNLIQSACLIFLSVLSTIASIGYTVLMLIFRIADPFIITILSVAIAFNIVYTIVNLVRSSKKYSDIKTTLIKNRIMSKFMRLFISFFNLGFTIMIMTTTVNDNALMEILIISAIVIYILGIAIQLIYTITRFKFYRKPDRKYGFAKTILLKVKDLLHIKQKPHK